MDSSSPTTLFSIDLAPELYPHKAADPSPLLSANKGDESDERMITALFVSVYVLVVCSVLFCITMAIIYFIRQRRREVLNRAVMQARANDKQPDFAYQQPMPIDNMESYEIANLQARFAGMAAAGDAGLGQGQAGAASGMGSFYY